MMPIMLAVGTGHSRVAPETLALGARADDRHHGRDHAVRDRRGAALLQQRLHSVGRQFWRLGTIFGVIFLVALLVIGVPLL